MNKVELTEKEISVIKAFKEDDYVGDLGWQDPSAGTWVEGFHKDCNMNGKEFSGVMSSLIKKDVMISNGECIFLTDLGRELAANI